MGLLPHEQTSDHDDACLSVMEELVTLYTKPLDEDRLLHVYRISTGTFPPPIGEPTPRHSSIPGKSGSCRTLPFHHTPQPVSPPGTDDYFVSSLLRTFVEELLVVSARVEVPRYRKRARYDANGHKTPKDFWRTNAETHESLVVFHAHGPS